MKAIRLQNFKGFRDTGWIELKPITLLFGHNSSGKSSILNALLMLKQSLENPDKKIPFTFSSENGVDLGVYEDIVYGHEINPEKPIGFSFKLEEEMMFSISVCYNQKQKKNEIISFNVKINNNFLKGFMNEWEANYSSHTIKGINRSLTKWHNFLINCADEDCLKFFDRLLDQIKDASTLEQEDKDRFLRPFVIQILRFNKGLEKYFNQLSNIGPVRAAPKRWQLFGGESPSTVGTRGENMLQMLYMSKHGDHPDYLENRVNDWLTAYHYRFEWKMLGSNMGQFILTDTRTGLQAPLKDVGFGLSQVLPVVIQSYAAKQGDTLLIEQPEIHLHSRAQAELGDLFLKAVNSYPEKEIKDRKRFIIETHSENLLLRIRRRLAENYLKKNPEFSITADDIVIYFIENTNGESVAHKIVLNEKGEFENMPEAFGKFFSDDFEEIMKINSSLAQIKSAESRNADQ